MGGKPPGFGGQQVAKGQALSALTPAKQGESGRPVPTADELARAAKFEARAPRYALDDVVLSDEALARVKGMLAKVEHHHVLYEQWGLKKLEQGAGRLVFNLYGPPGTGKTMLAEALAARLGRHLIEVSYAEIESKYVGDTPKNITAAFTAARESGAALFFDEADSILGRRMTSVTQASDHAVNVSRAVMLKQLDAFDGVVMFATNLARNFDDAFVRRILFHVEIPLPDAPALRRLWSSMLPEALPGRADLDLADLAAASEGLAGGDIRNVVVMAATEAVQRLGAGRRVTQGDLSRAIAHVRAAKAQVGAGGGPRPA